MDATCPPGGWDSLWESGTRGGGALAAYAAWWRPGLNLLYCAVAFGGLSAAACWLGTRARGVVAPTVPPPARPL